MPLALAVLGLVRFDQSSSDSVQAFIPGGRFEASGVVAVSGTSGALFVDDGTPRQIFWLGFSDRGAAAPAVPVALGTAVTDMEDIATDGTFVYVVGSQSQGGRRDAAGLVRFMFDARTRRASGVEVVRGLRGVLTSQVPELARLSSGRTGGLNIEGLAWDEARGRLLFGLRSPLAGRQAIVLSARLADRARPLSADNLRIDPEPIRLDLGGLAIRGLGYDGETKRLLVIGGSATDDPRTTFRLFEWTGVATSVPRAIRVLPSALKPEGVTRIVIGGRARTLVLFDGGSYQLVE